MKKTIFILGMALVTFTNVATASNVTEAKVYAVTMSATPLCNAISKGDVATIKKFIEYGVDVNEKANSMTPLMYAIRYNNIEIVKLLIEKGADLTAEDQNGNTALKIAQMFQKNEIVEVLKSAGARR